MLKVISENGSCNIEAGGKATELIQETAAVFATTVNKIVQEYDIDRTRVVAAILNEASNYY